MDKFIVDLVATYPKRDRDTAERLYIATLRSIRKLAARVDEGCSFEWHEGLKFPLPAQMPRDVLESELRLLAQLERELGIRYDAHS